MGAVEVDTVYGQDPTSGRWLCPLREALRLDPRQSLSPALIERLCFTATMSLSYEAAAAVAAMWGVDVSPSTIWQHVQKQGAMARARHEREVDEALEPATRPAVVATARRQGPRAPFSMVIMMDGWMIRERGEQWGLKPAEAEAERVAWREEKTAIVFRLDQRARTQSGRPVILDKKIEACRGDPHEFGRRVHALALREGMADAERVFVVADGGVWVWNIVEDRFGQAKQVLDYYHASQHLWAAAEALHPDDPDGAKQWVEPLLHQLRHGDETGVLHSLDDLPAQLEERQDEALKTIEREKNYFHTHRERLAYQSVAEEGCPVGSGAMESACAQLQDRFKRTGQFWVCDGHSNLMAIEIARRNQAWDQLWRAAA